MLTPPRAGCIRGMAAPRPREGIFDADDDTCGRDIDDGRGPTVTRVGYGAMQLAGPGVFGPPTDRDGRRRRPARGRRARRHHIDTSDFYGPHVTNEIIREALHPYPDGL